MKKNDQIRALIDAFSQLAENTAHSERSTMEALLDIFDPGELAELGYLSGKGLSLPERVWL